MRSNGRDLGRDSRDTGHGTGDTGGAPGAPGAAGDRARGAPPQQQDRTDVGGEHHHRDATPTDATRVPQSRVPAFSSLVLDVDSTLCGIEGVDWLAERRGAAVAAAVAGLTDRAMNGEIALDAVYGERLALIRPTAADVAALAEAYRGALAPGAERVLAALRAAGVRVVLVSGGLREALLPVAAALGIANGEVHAVRLRFDAWGEYAGFDTHSPLATQGGKLTVVTNLALPRPTLAVGDGATDLAVRPAVDAFAAFTGFVRRPAVAAGADFELASFDSLLEAALP